MPAYPELHGRNVLVTGGANGIGAATVAAFQEQGSRVYFCDVDAKAGQRLAKVARANFTRVDLRDEKQIASWIDKVASSAKRIDVLVNNAANDPRIPLQKLSAKEWDELFAVNLRSMFLCSRSAVPYMIAGAAIINLASITFHLAPPQMSAYVATKGGVLGFTRSLARELGPRRIRINAVSPGWVMTDRQLRQYVTPAVKRIIRTSQSMPDLIQPADIAQVILFLASDGSTAITGQEILADRGWMHS
jgi:NAD(P)-dependent dehydrogenase (short-subunit alcohol dehydrogenase family)